MPTAPGERTGVTIVEVLVAISLITILTALILPAVQSARETSRRVQCASHLKAVAQAAVAWSEQRRHIVPTVFTRETPQQRRMELRNWVVELLPHIDCRAEADRWHHDKAVTDPENLKVAAKHIATLTCPSDTTQLGAGDLSFAINGGIGNFHWDEQDQCHYTSDALNHRIDLNGDGTDCVANAPLARGSDFDILLQTRLSFWQNESHERVQDNQGFHHHTMATITDGASNTLYFAENLRTGCDETRPLVNWSSPRDRQATVFVSFGLCEANQCAAGRIDWSKANSGHAAINRGRNAKEGQSPFASSYHNGGVNVAMLDGSTRFLSESVDGRVYFALFTPRGGKLSGHPLDEGIVSTAF